MIKFTTNKPETILPKRQTKGAAGYDFYATEDVVIESVWNSCHKMTGIREQLRKNGNLNFDMLKKYEDRFFNSTLATIIETNVSWETDQQVVLFLMPRSGLSIKNSLIMPNSVGVIDQDYNLPNTIKFAYINLGPEDVHIKKGDRIGQGIFLNYLTVDDDNAEGKRVSGFGSTGR